MSYSDKVEGAWQYTKSAYWLSKDKARINIKVDTLKKNNADYTDIVLMLDLADFRIWYLILGVFIYLSNQCKSSKKSGFLLMEKINGRIQF